MNRQDLIKSEGNQLMDPIFHRSIDALLEGFKKNEAVILSTFHNVLEELYLMADRMQSSGKKGSISYLGVCYCLSSVFTGNYELRLDLYDKEFYLDENTCCVYWEPSFVTSYLLDDITYFKKEIRKKVPQIKTYEEQQFITGYMRNYMYVIWEFLRQKMPDVVEALKNNGIEVSEDFQVFFGEYMGKCTLVNYQ